MLQPVIMSKSCVTCPKNSNKTDTDTDNSNQVVIRNDPQVAEWLTKANDSSNIPTDYLPDLKEVQTYRVKTRFPKGLRVFAFASEPGFHQSPEKGYDKYQNSVITEVGENGLLTLVLERPGSYYVREDAMRFPAHIHLVPEHTENKGQWSNRLFTYVV